MNVTKEKIMEIKPGRTEIFVCEDDGKMQSAISMLSRAKRSKLPDGIVDYECRTAIQDGVCVMIIRALRESDEKVLNR